MFAAKVVKSPKKAVANPASNLAQQRSRPLQLLSDRSLNAGHRASWDFGQLPIFPSERTNRPEMQFSAQEPKVDLARPASFRFDHDSSRIPMHPPAAGVIQKKLAINQPGDSYEQEADRVAEGVMRMPELRLQRACPCAGGCSNCNTAQPVREHGSVQTQRVHTSDTGQTAAPPIVYEALRSPGQPLDPGTRAFMEPRFGYDFSRVRVQSGAPAGQSARDVNANAYTVGQNIVFAPGQFAPATRQGRQLIAHELTHVVQQNGGAAAIQRAPGGGTSPAPDPASRAVYQHYLEALRAEMAKPAVDDSQLAKIVELLYRDHPEIGSGSTAAAIRNELATGMPTKGKRHVQAGQDRLNMLSDWLKAQKTLREANEHARSIGKTVTKAEASARDVATAEHLFLDTREAIHSGYYAEFEITVPPPPGGGGGPGVKTDPGPTTPKLPETTVSSEVGAAAGPEMAEVVGTSFFKTAGRLLAREAPGLVLQLALMAIFPPRVKIHNEKAKELSRTKLEPAILASLEKQELVFEKLLDNDMSQSIYANVTAKLDYRVWAESSDLEVTLEDMTFLGMTITNQNEEQSDPKFDANAKPVSKHVTYSILLFEPEYVTRDREWAEAQRAYEECVHRYGTGHIPPAAGVDQGSNPEEGPCIPPHMKRMEGP